jgi:alginate O-acetyltransferase complex protein AlgI
MLFSSITFLFYFLPLTIISWIICHKNIKIANILLLIFSLIFYAWGEITFVLVILCSILLNYFLGRLIHLSLIKKLILSPQLILFISLLINLSVLIYFKYIIFIITNISLIFNIHLTAPNVTLPLGISFFTFQVIGYLVDIYKKEIQPTKNPINFALYLCFFPQLIAGPIIRYKDISHQITNRSISRANFSSGIETFIIGLAKKVIIANTLGSINTTILNDYSNDLTPALVILAILSHTIQFYFDFSGYSNMAIGLGRIFGFHIKENFNYPYIATSISDFWRRWHISLGEFFKHYVYIPLGGSRKGNFRTYLNLSIVFILCGLWHGANYIFIIWGLYFGFFIVLERLFLSKLLNKIHSILQTFYALIVIILGRAIFMSKDITHFLVLIKSLFYSSNKNSLHLYWTQNIYFILIFIISIFGCTPIFNKFFLSSNNKYISFLKNIYYIILLILSIAFLAGSTFNPFLYFRF